MGSTTDSLFSEYNNFTVGHGLIMLLIDCMWTFLLGLYLEQVTPKKFGRRRHICFCLSCKYWGCCRGGNNSSSNKSKKYDTKTQLAPGQEDDLDPVGMLSADNSRTEMIKTPGKTPTPTPGGRPRTNQGESVDQTQAFETRNMNIDCYEKLTPEVDERES